MENINVRERLFFYIVFVILIVLMAVMLKPFFTVLIVSLISVIMLKPLYNYYFGADMGQGAQSIGLFADAAHPAGGIDRPRPYHPPD